VFQTPQTIALRVIFSKVAIEKILLGLVNKNPEGVALL
jgi:hypothetical protein